MGIVLLNTFYTRGRIAVVLTLKVLAAIVADDFLVRFTHGGLHLRRVKPMPYNIFIHPPLEPLYLT